MGVIGRINTSEIDNPQSLLEQYAKLLKQIEDYFNMQVGFTQWEHNGQTYVDAIATARRLETPKEEVEFLNPVCRKGE